ncbi:MAG: DUF1501 domain-containing protein, partial [Armatimonadetes bacterium]|nr:DUF1501 domain-containing protein [Armatimonadota bacterium]
MPNHTHFTRRALLQHGTFSLGAVALAGLLQEEAAGLPPRTDARGGPTLAPRSGHFPARARSVIMLFQNGGPSHMDLFDPKPELTRRHGEKSSLTNAMQGNTEPLMGSRFRFQARGRSGIEFSELVPHLGAAVDDLCVVRSMYLSDPNHPGATYEMCTCNRRPGRPSLGAWIAYALGSENRNLPAYVCLRDPAVFHSGGYMQISNGWLPGLFRGTELRTEGDAVLNLRPAQKLPAGAQENARGLLARLNARHQRLYPNESELDARIENYELAARMQVAAAADLDLAQESPATQRMYGLDNPTTAAYGRRCLMARRLVERGVRFVQILAPAPHNVWDHHGNINTRLPEICAQVDRPSAALIQDLKQRGLLDETVVLWTGEFGRMPISQGGNGRDHNPHGFTVLLAGGGFKAG